MDAECMLRKRRSNIVYKVHPQDCGFLRQHCKRKVSDLVWTGILSSHTVKKCSLTKHNLNTRRNVYTARNGQWHRVRLTKTKWTRKFHDVSSTLGYSRFQAVHTANNIFSVIVSCTQGKWIAVPETAKMSVSHRLDFRFQKHTPFTGRPDSGMG